MQTNSEEYLFISSIVAEEFIDVNMTETISQHIKVRSKTDLKIDDYDNGQMQTFANFCENYIALRSCKELIGPCAFYNATYGIEILKKFNIIANDKLLYIVVNYNWLSKKKIEILILSNTILLFLRSQKSCDFLCALNPTALKLDYMGAKSLHKSIVVDEKSKEPLEYYDKFNPYTDSKILSRHWEKTNLDGTRSFAGGLKPENNPLHLELEYGVVKFHICGLNFDVAVSNNTVAQKFVESYGNIYCATNSLFFDNSKQRKIRKKCLKQYFSTNNYGNKESLTIPKKLILIISVLFGLMFVGGFITLLISLIIPQLL